MNKTSKELEDIMLSELNDFMKKYKIDSINFSKTHSIQKARGKKAKSILLREPFTKHSS